MDRDDTLSDLATQVIPRAASVSPDVDRTSVGIEPPNANTPRPLVGVSSVGETHYGSAIEVRTRPSSPGQLAAPHACFDDEPSAACPPWAVRSSSAESPESAVSATFFPSALLGVGVEPTASSPSAA